MALFDYKERMRNELAALKNRCEKLTAFLDTQTYDKLPDADQVLLLAQSVHMVGYVTFLQERVDRLDD